MQSHRKGVIGMTKEKAINYLRASGFSKEQRDEIIKALETRYGKLRRLTADLLWKGEIDERIHKIMIDEIDRLEEKDEP